jgi:RNA polymerase sigma-70 factor (ECF subfamily)
MEFVLRKFFARAIERPRSVSEVHAEHAGFVWRLLQRFGVREADREDVLQEVFVVVHQRLHTFDGSAELTTWLYTITRNVAWAWRRRASRRHEELTHEPPDRDDPAPSAEATVEARELRRRLDRALDALDLDRRAVFVMLEIDGCSYTEVAAITGVPVGTVSSRLDAAWKDLDRALKRLDAHDHWRAPR